MRKGRAEFLAQFARLATHEAQAVLRSVHRGHAAGVRPRSAPRATANPAATAPPRSAAAAPRRPGVHRSAARGARRRGARRSARSPCATSGRSAARSAPARQPGAHVRAGRRARAADRAARRHHLAPPLVERGSAYGGHGTPAPVGRERLAIPARSAILLAPGGRAMTRRSTRPRAPHRRGDRGQGAASDPVSQPPPPSPVLHATGPRRRVSLAERLATLHSPSGSSATASAATPRARIGGCPTRRYHGLLVAALPKPAGPHA